jgi:hypothetical protein
MIIKPSKSISAGFPDALKIKLHAQAAHNNGIINALISGLNDLQVRR